MSAPVRRARTGREAFTLVEVMVVIVILALLSSLVLVGLASGRRQGKVDTTKAIVRRLSMAIMDRYEEYEDFTGGSLTLVQLRQRMREEMPDSWSDVFGTPGSNLTLTGVNTPAGRAYQRYYQSGAPSPAYASAECLYMIITQSGMFTDVLAEIRPDRVGDIDKDGKREFWDGWNRPIAFMRWAPGFSSPLSPIQVANATTHHDPLDFTDPSQDPDAFAMFPLVYSGGPDEANNDPSATTGPNGYGLMTAPSGWPDAALVNPCSFVASGTSLVGSLDPLNSTAYRDNVFGHDLLGN